ncbi:DedA family protein [Roseivivax isoporae]|uniref:Alkaline phosphatase n=1 Tax=Roseivivax isoporae LMG 25204 TaxID=1449351 RepID=X7FCH6_9RHOB|nr:DedA family protein [Roseivivax isoporae]ETX29811.1 alkaline phosphatase [Roseivivax isoporae LMG 25204]
MPNWILDFMQQGGAVAVAALMFLENLFPPIPSEVVMPLAGYIAERDGTSLVLMIAGGSIGSLAGAFFWYWVGRRIGVDRLKDFSRAYGRWLTLTPGDIDAADRWFDRYGGLAVFFGRLIPGVRTFISVPAGISGMGLGKFLVFSAAGTVLWTAFLALAGWYLGQNYAAVEGWLGPVSNVIIVGLVAGYLYRVATFRRTVRKQDRKRERRERG